MSKMSRLQSNCYNFTFAYFYWFSLLSLSASLTGFVPKYYISLWASISLRIWSSSRSSRFKSRAISFCFSVKIWISFAYIAFFISFFCSKIAGVILSISPKTRFLTGTTSLSFLSSFDFEMQLLRSERVLKSWVTGMDSSGCSFLILL